MGQQTINIGTVANDGTGDPLRDAFDKINDNFTELYGSLAGLLELKGDTDCSGNPNYPAGLKGDAYYVTVAGKIGGASGKSVDVGDVYVAKADNAGGTEASVGTSWFVLEHNLSGVALLSGATFTGAVAVPDDAYDATTWNGSANVPTKNAVRDKFEALIIGAGGLSIASTSDVLTGTSTTAAVTPDALAALWEQGADIASAGTLSVGEGGHFHITGTTTITDIDPATDKAGRLFSLVFDGILTLTHNASTLILPTGANITTAAGDIAIFRSEGSDAVRCIGYQRASGAPLVGATFATASDINTGTDTTKALNSDALAGSKLGTATITLLVSDPAGSAITTGDGKAYWRVPSTVGGMDLVAVAAAVTTVSSSGIPTVQIANVTQAADMLTTKLTIDASETDSSTAATAAVIDTGNDDVATGDMLRIDIDVAGTGAKGLMVEMQFRLP